MTKARDLANFVSGTNSAIGTSQIDDDAITNAKIANESITINGSAVALGSSTTIETGTDWQSSVKTSTFTAAAGKGYFINTSGGAFEVDLPSSPSIGDVIEFVDFSRSFATNNLTLDQGSLKYQGNTSPKPVYSTNGQSIRIVYSGTTQGWIPTSDDDVSLETAQNYSVEMLVIAGGGAGGSGAHGGAGGAGGYRTSTQTFTKTQTYTITIGAGGTGAVNSGGSARSGSDTSVSGSGITTITSTGGGGGAYGHNTSAATGGSGGGGAGTINNTNLGASGNTPSTTPSQGNDGGDAYSVSGGGPNYATGGGGGAGAAGGDGSSSAGGVGGAGASSSITGSAVTRAGGGGGSCYSDGGGPSGAGGAGGGGAGGGSGNTPGAGTANTGSGGGGASGNNAVAGGAGGSGVVILSMLDADYSGTTSGSPTVATGVSGKTVLTFTGSGSYTA
jgi:hypothetical protein